MDMLGTIVAFSTIIWYVIDKFKPLWDGKVKYSKYLTILVSGIASFGISFGFGLDLVNGLGLTPELTTLGTVVTSLVLMSGSSAIAEVIERVKGKTDNTQK